MIILSILGILWATACIAIIIIVIFFRKRETAANILAITLLAIVVTALLALISYTVDDNLTGEETGYFQASDTEYNVDDRAAVSIVPLLTGRIIVIVVDYKSEVDTVFNVYKDQCKYKTMAPNGKEFIIIRRYRAVEHYPWVFRMQKDKGPELIFVRK
jgi:hypothetical protein